MTLEEKIKDRKVVYQLRGEEHIAFELALLYFVLAKRKNCKIKIAEACRHSLYWMRKAQVEVPEHVEKLSCQGQLEEIQILLVKAKAKIGAVSV